jgi:hypothetical protein
MCWNLSRRLSRVAIRTLNIMLRYRQKRFEPLLPGLNRSPLTKNYTVGKCTMARFAANNLENEKSTAYRR